MNHLASSWIGLAFALAGAVVMTGPASAQEIPSGRYECYYFTRAQSGLNFTINGGGSYTDVRGNPGHYSVSGGRITFSGGAHDGNPARYKGGNPPKISFVNARGEEAAFCQLRR